MPRVSEPDLKSTSKTTLTHQHNFPSLPQPPPTMGHRIRTPECGATNRRDLIIKPKLKPKPKPNSTSKSQRELQHGPRSQRQLSHPSSRLPPKSLRPSTSAEVLRRYRRNGKAKRRTRPRHLQLSGKLLRKNYVDSDQHIRKVLMRHNISMDKERTPASLVERVSGLIRESCGGKASLRDLFLRWDLNRDGWVDAEELLEIGSAGGFQLNPEEAEEICCYFSNDKKVAKMSYDKFVSFVYKEDTAENDQPIHKKYTEQLRHRLRDLGVTEEEIQKCGKNLGSKLWKLEEIVPLLKKKYQAKVSLAAAWGYINEERDNAVTREELEKFLQREGFAFEDQELDKLFKHFDSDNNGEIDFGEFTSVVFPEEDLQGYVGSTFGTKTVPPSGTEESDTSQEQKQVTLQKNPEDQEDSLKRRTAITSIDTVPVGKSNGRSFLTRITPVLEAMEAGLQTAIRATRLRQRLCRKLREVFRMKAATEAFKHFDKNADGVISYTEFKEAVKSLNFGMTSQDCDIICRYIDRDGDGHINYYEFQKKIVSGFGETNSQHELQIDSEPQRKGLGQKYASLANIGSHRPPGPMQKALKQKIRQKRRIFPTHQLQSTRGEAKLRSLQSSLVATTRRANTPFHATTNLITPAPGTPFLHGGYCIAPEERFSKESERIRGGLKASKSFDYLSPDVLDRHRARISAKHKLQSMKKAMEMRDRPSTTAALTDPNRRLRTVLKQRLSYHVMLEDRLDKDQAKRDIVGW